MHKNCPRCGKGLVVFNSRTHCSHDCMRLDPAYVEVVKARFWAKVEKGDGCWIWQGSRSSAHNYPTFNYFGHIIHAHRAIWQLLHGALPGRHVHVLHRCNNGALGCVRPDHLYLGGDKENTADKVAAGKILRGEQHRSAKLTGAMVIEARKLRARGLTYREISERIGNPVAQSTLHKAVTGGHWRHVG